ncbi:Nonribosomal Peptide Synthase (NRPS) [Pseudogymnoascus sp. 03VT05]|nr:Nonribosomal Peptide Synthase (NRPS) [Pseudogymnoascus sp. 03VT05]
MAPLGHNIACETTHISILTQDGDEFDEKNAPVTWSGHSAEGSSLDSRSSSSLDGTSTLPEAEHRSERFAHIECAIRGDWVLPTPGTHVALAALSLLCAKYSISREEYFWLENPKPDLVNKTDQKRYAGPFRIPYDGKVSVAKYCAITRARLESYTSQSAAPILAGDGTEHSPRMLVTIHQHSDDNSEEAAWHYSAYRNQEHTERRTPLQFQISISDRNIHTRIYFDSDMLSQAHVSRLLQSFEHVVEQLIYQQNTPIAQISIVGLDELAVLHSWNATISPRVDRTVQDLITDVMNTHPKKQAVCAWDGNLTYGQLETLSDKLASSLQSHGVKAGVRLPILLGRSKMVAVSMLGALKTGAAIVMVDCGDPVSRLKMVIEQIEPKVVLASRQYAALACSLYSEVIIVEEAIIADASTNVVKESAKDISPAATAYVVFTSGSSGTPKGVVTSHSAFCTSALSHGIALGINSDSRVLGFASPAFDISMTEVLTTLIRGATVCFPHEEERNNLIVGAVERMGVNWIVWTPTFANFIEPSQLPGLKTLVLGGEAPSQSLVSAWRAYPRTAVINAYGPSEVSVWSSANKRLLNSHNVKNIGYPIGTALWVVDPEDLTLQPIGTPGELLIGGHSLANGYLNNPAKTSEAFIDAPAWLKGYEGKLYRTGDLVQYETTGEVLYIGRIDAQVKIRGQRIELGEVEAGLSLCLLSKNDSLKVEIAVEACEKPAGGLGLVAFLSRANLTRQLQPGKQGELLKSALDREWTQDQIRTINEMENNSLTAAMRPFSYIPLNGLPLAPGGKLDRARLRAIAASLTPQELGANSTYDEPEDDTDPGDLLKSGEQALAQLWSSILGINAVKLRASSNFFSKGGDSIAAMRLVKLLAYQKLSLSVKSIFQSPLLGDQALEITTLSATESILPFSLVPKPEKLPELLDAAARQCNVNVNEIEDLYPCSPLQECLFITSLTNPGAYVEPWTFEMPADLDRDDFRETWNRLVLSEPVLRTRIIQRNSGSVMQTVLNQSIEWSFFEDLQAHLDEKLSLRPSPGGPLVQFAIGPKHFVVIMHHSVYDGHSLPLMFERATNLTGTATPRVNASFKGFIKYCIDIDRAAASEFWSKSLQGSPASSFPAVPLGHQPGTDALFQQDVSFAFSSAVITKSTILRAAYALLLTKYENTSDVCFGTTLSGRNADISGLTDMLGPTISTVPIRVSLEDDQLVGQFLESIRDQSIAMIPFEQLGLQNISRLSSDTAMACSFKSILIVQPSDADSGKLGEALQLRIRLLSTDIERHPYPMVVESSMTPQGASVSIWYDSKIIEETRVQRFVSQYERILQELCCANFHDNVGKIQAFSPSDLQVLRSWNSKLPQLREDTVHGWIDRTSSLDYHSVALSSTTFSLTYEQLQKLSQQVANFLASKVDGLKGRYVPILFDKTPFAVVAMLGILKAGGAFVPLDPRNPAARLQMIVDDVNAPWFSVQNAIVAEEETIARWKSEPRTRVNVRPAATSYVIFTSGTTGKPKGVQVQHQTFCSSVAGKASVYCRMAESRMLSFASWAFDSSLDELFVTLAVGGTICIPNDEERTDDLVGFINRMGINTVDLPQSVANLFYSSEVPSVEVVIIGGEEMSKATIERWCKHVALINAYGPTEASVTSVAEVMKPDMRTVRIGKGVGCRLWIVNPNNTQQLAAIGQVGELLLEGPILAQGYLNDPVKTSASFLESPSWSVFFSPSVSRLYCTGDLCAYDSDGSLISMVAKTSKSKYGVSESNLERLRTLYTNVYPKETWPFQGLVTQAVSQMQKLVPPYMLPSVFIPLSHIPLTVSGKIDRKHLQAMASRLTLEEMKAFSESTSGDRLMPVTEMQHRIAGLFAVALGIGLDTIHLQASFFRLGGNSIDIMKLTALSRAQAIPLTTRDVFENHTLEALAKVAANKSAVAPLVLAETKSMAKSDLAVLQKILHDQGGVNQASIDEIYTATPTQEWFMRHGRQRAHYLSIRFTYHLSTTVSEKAIGEGWKAVVESTPILRTRLFEREGKYFQAVIAEEISLAFVEETLPDAKAKLMPGNWGNATSLSQAFVVLEPSGARYFVLDMHHSICDGWSSELLIQRLNKACLGKPLAPTPSFSHIISRTPKANPVSEKDFWQRYFADVRPAKLFAYPESYVPALTSRSHKRLPIVQRPNAEVTIAIMAQAAWGLAIAQQTGSESAVLRTVSMGRDIDVVGIDEAIARLLHYVPLIVRIGTSDDIPSFLRQVRRTLLDVTPHREAHLDEIATYSSDARLGCDNAISCDVHFKNFIAEPSGEEVVFRKIDHVTLAPGAYPVFIETDLMDDCVEFTVEYDETIFGADVISDLMLRAEQHLYAFSGCLLES